MPPSPKEAPKHMESEASKAENAPETFITPIKINNNINSQVTFLNTRTPVVTAAQSCVFKEEPPATIEKSSEPDTNDIPSIESVSKEEVKTGKTQQEDEGSMSVVFMVVACGVVLMSVLFSIYF